MKVTREKTGDMVITRDKGEHYSPLDGLMAAAEYCHESAKRYLRMHDVAKDCGRLSEAHEAFLSAKYMREERERLASHAKRVPVTDRRGLETRTLTLPDRVQRRTMAAPAAVGKVTGYGAVFYTAANPGTEYRLAPDLMERIHPKAFDRAIAEKHDCRALFNHDPGIVLGRTATGSLRLAVDRVGLWYAANPPENHQTDYVRSLLAGGYVDGSSFSFCCRKERIIRGSGNAPDIRQIEDLDLFDVCPVTFPAYEAATSELV